MAEPPGKHIRNWFSVLPAIRGASLRGVRRAQGCYRVDILPAAPKSLPEPLRTKKRGILARVLMLATDAGGPGRGNQTEKRSCGG